jgi:hypothetical protein
MYLVRTIFFVGLFIALMLFAGCKRKIPGCTDRSAVNYNPRATVLSSSDPCLYTGMVSFWSKAGVATSVATVYIAGMTATVGPGGYSQVTSCGAPAAANFTLVAGVYDFTISSAQGTGTGTVNIEKDKCKVIRAG